MEIPTDPDGIAITAVENGGCDTTTTTTTTPTLIPHTNPKSPYWVHYQIYHPVLHHTKTKIAVCNFCQKEISVKQGTGGLKSHLKCKHREVYVHLALTLGVHVENDPEQQLASFPNDTAASSVAASATSGTIINGRRRRGRQASSNANSVSPATTAESIDNDERRKHEKHLLEMWSYTRREIHALRQELKNSRTIDDDDGEDADQQQELENDIRRLMKRKAEYAAQLGLEE